LPDSGSPAWIFLLTNASDEYLPLARRAAGRAPVTFLVCERFGRAGSAVPGR
jgi:hypothetical protein